MVTHLSPSLRNSLFIAMINTYPQALHAILPSLNDEEMSEVLQPLNFSSIVGEIHLNAMYSYITVE